MSIRAKTGSAQSIGSHPPPRGKGIVTLAEAAQTVLDRWTRGDLAAAVRELDLALRQYRLSLRLEQLELDQTRGRHDCG